MTMDFMKTMLKEIIFKLDMGKNLVVFYEEEDSCFIVYFDP